jgi:polyisoprenoid-binding protein YceI
MWKRGDDRSAAGTTCWGMAANRRGTASIVAIAFALSHGMAPAWAQPAVPRWEAAGEVRYHARDALTAWSGVAEIAAMDVTLDPDDLGTLRLTATVRTASFGSGNFLRDRQARREVFASDTYPSATLVARAGPAAAGRGLPATGAVAITLEAELTLHGVTRRYLVTAELRRAPPGTDGVAAIHAEAEFAVSIEGHGMRRPSLFGLVTDDEVRVTVAATARPAPAPTPTTP